MSKTFAVIGNHVTCSLSPLVHNLLYRRYRLDANYESVSMDADSLSDFVSRLGKDICGINVTMPFKKEIIPYLNVISEVSRLSQSVNTVVREGDLLCGHSTDGIGFRRSLEREDIPYKGKELLLLGAGGAARAVALDYAMNGGTKITVCNRSSEAADALCRLVSPYTEVSVCPYDDLRLAARNADVVADATPIGMSQIAFDPDFYGFVDFLPKESFICDLVYRPLRTPLLEKAERCGLRCINGLPMLIYQAFESFRLWFSITPSDSDFDCIYTKCIEALSQKEEVVL